MRDVVAGTRRSRDVAVRVRYAETDQMGVVYYSNYFVWFEVGRTDCCANRLELREMEADGSSLPVIEAHCEYRPARATTMNWRSGRRARCVAGPNGVRLRGRASRDARCSPPGAPCTRRSIETGSPCRLPGASKELLA